LWIIRPIDTLRGFGPRKVRLAWPVFVVFLAQRLLTVAFVYLTPGGLLSLVTRWDAGWYLRLAQDGYVYPNISPDGPVRASNLAYLPLFPYVRQLLPAFVLLIRPVRMRVPRIGAIAALTVGSILMSWGSAQFLSNPGSGCDVANAYTARCGWNKGKRAGRSRRRGQNGP
jgi:hypothetical protein